MSRRRMPRGRSARLRRRVTAVAFVIAAALAAGAALLWALAA